MGTLPNSLSEWTGPKQSKLIVCHQNGCPKKYQVQKLEEEVFLQRTRLDADLSGAGAGGSIEASNRGGGPGTGVLSRRAAFLFGGLLLDGREKPGPK